ncbi:HAMP domain-containing histidine kinase [Solitalea sp. MAHUQ-68]|uniref:histidine kinase n=1 Tax=Solitalea agri TaxID=2953739 RepID=A0A9X2JG25_9SPHI|nr:HAMP domain-containing sensor histidine kinase [Solitalea agri]MCO4293996.1 HAMP domain-containing histidine kinase [Solitalea agri]
MRLQAKFAAYNIITKIVIIVSLAFVFDFGAERVAYNHLDTRILQKKQQFIKNLSGKEISEYITEQDTDFASYNVLKEEYILLKIIPPVNEKDSIGNFSNEERVIENQTSNYRILTYDFDFDEHQYQLEIGESLSSIKQFQETFRNYTLLVLFVAISLTLITDFLFTGYLLKPLSTIINKRLKDVNDPSHFNFDSITTSTSDFQHLDKQLKEMLMRISTSFYTQKEFIANVSHEIITPIAILKTRFENLLNDESVGEEVQNQIYSSLNTLHWLKNVVNSLLLISKIENEQFKQEDEIDIHKQIQQISEEVEHRLEEKDIELNINLMHSFKFKGNEALIRTMIFNVVTNAIKYNRLKGSINISDQIINSHYELLISDTGVGIEPELLKTIFKRFGKPATIEENSNGLGLSIVKTIASFHNIDVSISSTPQRGTTVLFKFPILS